MASWQLALQRPPQEGRAFDRWLQHAAGRILFEDVRKYAVEKVDPTLPPAARNAALKGINDAVFGLMMVIDGVSGAIDGETQSVGLAVTARLVDHEREQVIAELNLRNGDGMCMGYHGWLADNYGDDPVAIPKPEN